jgi:hypothetical protein
LSDDSVSVAPHGCRALALLQVAEELDEPGDEVDIFVKST